MTLLVENLNHKQAGLIVESTDEVTPSGLRPLYMQGIFIQGGVTNHNRRVYPVDEIRSAVDQVNVLLESGESLLGECDHPQGLDLSLDRVSHKIIKMWMDGNNGMGKLKIVPTPLGNIIRVLIEEGVRLGVSSRGEGEVDKRGYVSNFKITTVDIVAKPSAPAAYPMIVHESLNSKRGSVIESLAKDMNGDIKAANYLKDELRSFINNISKR